jgi:hypothetical protein
MMRRRWSLTIVSDQGAAIENEDSYSVTAVPWGLRLGVFDGAGAVESRKEGLTGRDAAIAASEIVSLSEPNLSPSELLKLANDRIGEINRASGNDFGDPLSLCGAVGAIVKIDELARKVEFALIGDTVVIVGYSDGGFEAFSAREFEKFSRRTFIAMMEARSRAALEPARQIDWARPQLIENRKMANSPDGEGHGVLNGMDSAMQYEKTGRIQSEKLEFVAVITDGMLLPEPGIDTQKDLALEVRKIREVGLQGLLDETRAIESDDPWLLKPRTKVHDDATGVLVTFLV